MKYSRDPRIDAKVRELVGKGWTVKNGGHPRLISPAGQSICYFVTPSDHRSALNWLARLRRMTG